MTPANNKYIEKVTRGQSSNNLWFTCRKGVMSGSKGHDVKTKMKKIRNANIGYENLWQIFQKISGLTFVSPDIPALKYRQAMEENAANEFLNHFSKQHINLKLHECGLFLDEKEPFIGASPDRIMTCLCCPKACVEIKCPYSINYTSPNDPDVTLIYLEKN